MKCYRTQPQAISHVRVRFLLLKEEVFYLFFLLLIVKKTILLSWIARFIEVCFSRGGNELQLEAVVVMVVKVSKCKNFSMVNGRKMQRLFCKIHLM